MAKKKRSGDWDNPTSPESNESLENEGSEEDSLDADLLEDEEDSSSEDGDM